MGTHHGHLERVGSGGKREEPVHDVFRGVQAEAGLGNEGRPHPHGANPRGDDEAHHVLSQKAAWERRALQSIGGANADGKRAGGGRPRRPTPAQNERDSTVRRSRDATDAVRLGGP